MSTTPIPRKAFAFTVQMLGEFPAVGIVGPRQCGKTTMARHIAERVSGSLFLDLELPSDLAKLSDPELFLEAYRDKLIVLDEIQVMPELFPILRALIDRDRKPGRFLILGSASPDLLRKSSDSLAGRIYYRELTPFRIDEVGIKKKDDLWFRGGFPDSFLSQSDEISLRWLDSYLRAYRERDLPLLGLDRNSVFLSRFFSMLARLQGETQNVSNLARSLGLTGPTIARYLELMEGSFLLRRLPAFYTNLKKRIVKSPKLYIRDSGILHRTLGIRNREELAGHPAIGASYEGFIIELTFSILTNSGYELFYYRTHGGTELDLVITKGGIPILGVEIKRTRSPGITPSMRESIADLGLERILIVCEIDGTYPLAKEIQATGLPDYVRILENLTATS